jgi:hypothetical protein
MLAGALASGSAIYVRQVKGRGQTKCHPRSSRSGVGHGANNPTTEKCTVTKPATPRPRWVDNIKIDRREIGWYGLDLGQDRGQWRALVNKVMNLRVP